jgi:hypothetical protein
VNTFWGAVEEPYRCLGCAASGATPCDRVRHKFSGTIKRLAGHLQSNWSHLDASGRNRISIRTVPLPVWLPHMSLGSAQIELHASTIDHATLCGVGQANGATLTSSLRGAADSKDGSNCVENRPPCGVANKAISTSAAPTRAAGASTATSRSRKETPPSSGRTEMTRRFRRAAAPVCTAAYRRTPLRRAAEVGPSDP